MKRQKSLTSSIVELVVIVAVALGLALAIQAFVVKPYRIPSGSMEPTLKIGQRVLVNRIGMDFGEPHVGEIAVFHPPEGAEQQLCGPTAHTVDPGGAACSQPLPKEASVNFIKRIVAGPGDEIYVKEGHVYRKAAGTSKLRAPSRTPTSKPAGQLRVQLPHADQDPGGTLVHDGRQPRRLRRQQILGAGPHGLDHRAGHRHLLAPRPHRDLLARHARGLTVACVARQRELASSDATSGRARTAASGSAPQAHTIEPTRMICSW